MSVLVLRSKKVFFLLVAVVAVGIYVWTTKTHLTHFTLFSADIERALMSDRNPGEEIVFTSKEKLSPATVVEVETLTLSSPNQRNSGQERMISEEALESLVQGTTSNVSLQTENETRTSYQESDPLEKEKMLT
ncbi:hypothetical protein OS493_032334 [Desmophyllum pertusum]|uniref:Uncharacterized protein n=1 Tax=Desmophyllum pertusum TaxID=174260 RepID=A0A9W9YXB9_9CNID|nr:hypothetical protein OS493_032334 [Desmophyllum pertusum]